MHFILKFFRRKPTSIELDVLGVGEYRVSELTFELERKLDIQEVGRALCGDGSCRKENIDSSCFASEICARKGVPNMTIASLSSEAHALVAYLADTYRFIGCITANKPSPFHKQLFPTTMSYSDVRVLSNLCVEQVYRQRGVAGSLVAEMLNLIQGATPGAKCYLLVMQGFDEAFDRSLLADRAAALMTMYKSMGFRVVEADTGLRNGYVLMEHAPTPYS